MKKPIATAAALTVMAALSGCAQFPLPAPQEEAPEKLTVSPVSFAGLKGWRTGRQAEVLTALVRSCERLARQPASRSLGANGIAGTMADWRQVCTAAEALPGDNDETARQFFEKRFNAYQVEGEGLFTGYYEASLRGALRPGGPYRTPLYKRPDDLVMVDLGKFDPDWKGKRTAGTVVNGRLKPFSDREAIRKGALLGKGLELVWVDDPVDAFFLQVQGSGRVVLAEGGVLRVGYDGHNGHRYTSIGKKMIEQGHLEREKVSLQSIRGWLAAHPDQVDPILDLNRSFIFFRSLKGDGPVGSQGVPLVPGRSLAVDRRFIPMGVPVWLETTDPLDPERPLRRLMVAQDTGGAIKGPVRGDVFFGAGPLAEQRAGHMKQTGRYTLLLPKTVVPPPTLLTTAAR